MSDQPVVADSTPAAFEEQNVSLEEFSRYRESGELPERFKPTEVVDAPEQTVEPEAEEPEPEPDSEPEESQEPKGKGAEKRIKQLLAEKKAAEARAEELARKLAEKQDVKPPESSPAQRAKPTIDDKNPDGSPKYTDWDAYNEDFVDWKAEQKMAEYKREQAKQEAQRTFESQMSEVRTRYEDADAVIAPAIKALNEAKLPQAVTEVFGTSPQFFDLCYEVGSDPEKMEKFISLARTNPREALKQVFLSEDKLVRQRDEKGKFISKEAPEPKKTTAPKPPAPVGGASTRSFDVSDDSLSADEWMRKRNAQLAKKG